MAKLDGKLCEDCVEYRDEHVPATQEWDARYMDSGGLYLCERCADRRQEASCSEPDYGAVSITEQHAAADRARRALRQRD